MKYRSIYKDSKELALFYGKSDRNPGISERAVYVDPFGCDFRVCFMDPFYRGIGKMRGNLKIFIGGREVYSFNEDQPEFEWIIDGVWKELATELWSYEFSAKMEEPYKVNNTLVELCKREAEINRAFFDRYRKLCLSFVKNEQAEASWSESFDYYTFREDVDGHKIEIGMERKRPKKDGVYWDQVELRFDEKSMFRFAWNSSNAGGIFNEEGNYVSGEWEQFLEKLVDS